MRNPLGMALSSAVDGLDPGFAPQTTPAPQGLSKGQLIMGVLADALAGAQGRPGAFAAQQGQMRQQEREEAQWSRRRQETNDDWQRREQWKLANPDPSPMVRDAAAWAGMTPDMKAAYREAQAAKPQFIPDGLGGGQWAAPPAMPSGPPAITEDLWSKGVPMGGAAPKAPTPFPRRSPLPAR